MEQRCKQCTRPFARTRQHPLYCSEECQITARQRLCTYCRQTFPLKTEGDRRRYCHDPVCRRAARVAARAVRNAPTYVTCMWTMCPKKQELIRVRPGKASQPHYHTDGCMQEWTRFRTEAARHLNAAHVVKSRVQVECAWDKCPKRQELISLFPSEAPGNHYHSDGCYQAWLVSGGPRKGRGNGKILDCERCGALIGYRSPSQLKQKVCSICAPSERRASLLARAATVARQRTPGPRSCGGERGCARPGCVGTRYLTPSVLREREGKPVYCTRACWMAVRRMTRVPVRCTLCGDVRAYHRANVPRSADLTTGTWLCPDCRPRRTVWALHTCAHAGCGVEVRLRVRVDREQRVPLPHYCRQHRTAYFTALRRARLCKRLGCGTLITRRKGGPYCSVACATAVTSQTRKGRTYKSEAERLIAAKYDEGIRGVRPLAKAAGVCENTVRRVIRAGSLVAPRGA